jgi:PLP dependent protein
MTSPAAPIDPAANRERVLARLADAARAAGRDPTSVTLLAVSKTFGPDAVRAMASTGQRAFGENYLQEGVEKIAALRDALRPAPGLTGVPGSTDSADSPSLQWHFIGPIQSNKTRPIAEHFDWVHSVDREKVARRLSEQRPPAMPPLQVCIQVNVSGEASKSGCEPDQVLALARIVAGLPGLALRGLMAIPEPTGDPKVQRARFASLASLLEALRSSGLALDTLSMGMSDDLEAAIAEGATIVRVGTALFGRRTGSPVVRPSP